MYAPVFNVESLVCYREDDDDLAKELDVLSLQNKVSDVSEDEALHTKQINQRKKASVGLQINV